MSTDLQTTQPAQPPATQIRETVATIKARVQLVQHVMRDVMKKDVHYGTIPGTPKPTLYKPGAEVIALAFQFAPRYLVDDHLSTTENVHYRVTCELYSRETGAFIGSGQGECSSDEEKYKWRKAICEAEFDATLEDRRRLKFYKGGGTAKQVRIEPADIANTILKMAEKRAFIDAIRTTTGCSDMFGQDLDDLPAEVREEMGGHSHEPPKPLGADGWKTLIGQAEGFGYTADDVVASAAVAGYEGDPAQMPRDIAKRLFRTMRDNQASHPAGPADDGPDDEEPHSGTQRPPEGDESAKGGHASPAAPGDDTGEKPMTRTATDDTETIPGLDAEQFKAKREAESAAQERPRSAKAAAERAAAGAAKREAARPPSAAKQTMLAAKADELARIAGADATAYVLNSCAGTADVTQVTDQYADAALEQLQAAITRAREAREGEA